MRISLPSFSVGVLAATLVAVPAAAIVGVAAAPDPRPNTYDGTSPTLTLSPVEFVLGASIDAADPPNGCAASSWNFSVPLRMRWSVADATSAVAGVDVWGVGPRFDGFKKVVANSSGSTFDYTGGNYTGDCGEGNTFDNYYWVTARDNRGNTASSGVVGQYLEAWQEDGYTADGYAGLAVTRTGTWRAASCTCFNNGKTLYSTTAGASLSYRVTADQPGQTVAIVVEKNSNRGTANISLDGGSATAVSTYAASPTHRVIVWQRTLSVGTHTIKVANAGTSGRSRVDVDGVLLTRGPSNQAPPELPESGLD